MAPRPKTKAALQPAGEPFLGQSDGEQDDVLNARDQLLHDNLQNYLAAVGGNKAGAKLQPLRQVAGLGNNTNAAGATGAGGSGAAGAGLQQGGKQAQAQQQAQAVAALNDKVSGPMMAPVIKAIEEGFNKLNRRAAADHLEVEKHIKTSNESLQTAASQHAAVQRDVHEMLEGLLDDLESGRSELLGALRTEVVAPLEAALSGLAAKYKIRLAAD
eukprot:XP_001701803.1 predicted protein [Chlamydomonas reinhardtii]